MRFTLVLCCVLPLYGCFATGSACVCKATGAESVSFLSGEAAIRGGGGGAAVAVKNRGEQ